MKSVISGTARTLQTLVDGTVRLKIDFEPMDALAVMQAFGEPGVTVAVARLTQEAAKETLQAGYMQRLPEPVPSTMDTASKTPTVTEKPKRHWCVGSLCQSAIQLCNEPEFQKYLNARSEAEASGNLKKLLKIESRKEIDTDPRAKKIFMELMGKYGRKNNESTD